MFTDVEAKKKWCPMVRSRALGPEGETLSISTNIDSDANWSVKCIACECMMWRWYDVEMVGGECDDKFGTGYCGLAGKP